MDKNTRIRELEEYNKILQYKVSVKDKEIDSLRESLIMFKQKIKTLIPKEGFDTDKSKIKETNYEPGC